MKGEGRFKSHEMKSTRLLTKLVALSVLLTPASCNEEGHDQDAPVFNNQGLECFEKARFEELFLGKPESFVRERLGSPDEVDAVYAGNARTGSRSGLGGWDGQQDVQIETYRTVYKSVIRYDNRVFDVQPENMILHAYLLFDADDRYVEKVRYKQ